MDALGSGRRAAATGLVALVGGIAAPSAFAQAALPEAQSSPTANMTGPGFQEHHEFRGSEEHIDVNVCSTAIAPNSAL